MGRHLRLTFNRHDLTDPTLLELRVFQGSTMTLMLVPLPIASCKPLQTTSLPLVMARQAHEDLEVGFNFQRLDEASIPLYRKRVEKE